MSRLTESLAPGGAHHRLQQLIGDWEGMTRTWYEPDNLVITAYNITPDGQAVKGVETIYRRK